MAQASNAANVSREEFNALRNTVDDLIGRLRVAEDKIATLEAVIEDSPAPPQDDEA